MSRRGPIVAAIVTGVVALLLIVLLVLPKMGQVSDTQDRLVAAEDQELALQAQLQALQDAQAAAPQTEQEIEQLDAQVPPTADLPGLFRYLQAAADRSAVDFFQFTPGAPLPDATGEFSTISSQIIVTGGYFSVQEFLYNLEALPRANKVMSVAIAPLGETSETGTPTISTSGRLQAQLTVEFYTTDTSAGPGSSPGPTEGSQGAAATATDAAADAAAGAAGTGSDAT
jgi:Tfp pilus assembly protein PilO